MAAVIFVVTIPTEEEEARLRNEFIARKLDQRSDRIDPKITQPTTATTKAPMAIAEENDEDETSSMITIDMQTTPVTTTNLANGTRFGTFPKRRKSDTTMLQKPTIDDMLGVDNTKPSPAATTTTTTTTAKSQAVLEEMVAAAVAAGGGSVGGGGGGGGGGISAPCSLKDLVMEVNDAPPSSRKSFDGLRDILSTTKRKSSKSKKMLMTNPFDLNIPTDTCMEIVLREILKRYDVLNAIWTKDTEGRMHQVIFTIDFDETYENILEKFYEWGIGDREGSAVSVMNCIASKTYERKDDFDLDDDEFKGKNINAQKQGAWERFMNSVRSRLNVAQIVRDVRQDASITFDFLVLLVSAAILASFGLVEDSTIFLASSMLISPLMGPIIAGIFGTVIKDHSLRTLGVKNELFGIFAATLVGFVFGLIVCTLDERYSAGEGLTSEMLSRCELHSLFVGIFTAIPSGAAAAISILGGNIGSLVGVAISASLLPPAVNSGLLWALACIYKFFENDESRFNNVVKTNLYSNNQAAELAVLGSISMCLTISNVLCVYIMGIVVLKVKEIAPVISRNNCEFWKHDIKIARDLNKNGFDSDAAIIDEFANLPKEDQKVLGIDYEMLRNIHLDEATYQNTWSPIGNRHLLESSYEPMRENYSTVHRIERLYSTITRQQSVNERKHKFNFARRPPGRMSDIGATYRPLSGNLPRCATMPGNSAFPPNFASPTAGRDSNSSEALNSNLTSSMSEERKRRKFIVTPAVDPLHYLDEVSLVDEIDV